MKSRNVFWLIVIVLLLIAGILSYPVYEGTIGPWPVTYLITLFVGLLYMVVFGIFMWESIMKDPNDDTGVN